MRRRVLLLATIVLSGSLCACTRPQTGPAATRSQPAASGNHLNVLLVTLDTSRADHLGAYGDNAALTPALDALAARGTLFEHAYTSCPQTLPAHATLLTGLQPPEHGLHANGKNQLASTIPTLAEILAQHGYQTAAFVAAFVLDAKFGLNRGFQTYDDDLSQAPKQDLPEPLSVARPGNLVVDAALAWLGKQSLGPAAGVCSAGPLPFGSLQAAKSDRLLGESQQPTGHDQPSAVGHEPFFIWVHLYDPHYPYAVHPELQGTKFENVASYDGDVAFMDSQVGRLTAFLDEYHLRSNTLVIAVGDHGEGLEEHGEVEHGYLLNEEVLHVPLILSLPGTVREGQRVGALVSLVDLFATVLDVLDVHADAPTHGRSLAAALRGESIDSQPSYAESDLPYSIYGWSPVRSLTTPEWKYIRTARPELYARASDRKELYNLAGARAEQAQGLDQRLAAMEQQLVVRRAPAVALKETDKERLRALGYAAEGQDTRPVAPANAGAPGAGPQAHLKDIKDMLGVKHLDTQLFRRLSFGTIDVSERLGMARELVRRSPETASFQWRLGGALLAAGKLDEAATHLTEALRINPESAEAYSTLGNVREQQGQLDDARKQYAEALRVDPGYADADFGMGNVLAAQGTLDSALGYYAEAVRLRPDFANAYYNMGNTLARRGKIGAAIERYRAALEHAPGFADAHYNLANLLRRQGQLDDAVAHYTEAIRLKPDFVDAESNLGVTLAAQKKFEAAAQHYRQALRIQPRFARAHFNLGNALAEQGQFAAAIKELSESVQLQPKVAEFADGLAWVLATCRDAKWRDVRRAVALAEKACELTHRDAAHPLATLATAYAAADRFADAAHTAEQAARLARAEGEEDLAAELQRRVASYTHGQLAER